MTEKPGNGHDWIKVSTLSEDACFTWCLLLGVHRGKDSRELVDFNERFRLQYGTNFDESPRSVWFNRFEKGKRELADRGAIELERSATGGWSVRRIFPDKVIKG